MAISEFSKQYHEKMFPGLYFRIFGNRSGVYGAV